MKREILVVDCGPADLLVGGGCPAYDQCAPNDLCRLDPPTRSLGTRRREGGHAPPKWCPLLQGPVLLVGRHPAGRLPGRKEETKNPVI